MVSLFVLILMNSIYCEYSNYRRLADDNSEGVGVKRFRDYYATSTSLLEKKKPDEMFIFISLTQRETTLRLTISITRLHNHERF